MTCCLHDSENLIVYPMFSCHGDVCHVVGACCAVSVGVGGGLDSSCVERSVGDSLSVATAPGSV